MPSGSKIPILETQRLILRGHRVADFADVAEMWRDPAVVAHISGIPSNTHQSWNRFLRYSGLWHHLGFGYWLVESKADGSFVGEVGFADYKRDTAPSIEGLPEAGWVLKTSAQGQGFATEAVTRMLSWADLNLDRAKSICLIDPAHTSSIAVAEKVGFANKVIGHFETHETVFMERSRRRC